MRAGPVKIPGNVLLSPICGVSDSPFRTIARRHGAAMVFCEMTSSDGLARGNPKTFELLEYRPHERPIGAQLCGSDPEVMADAAKKCEGLGFDTLDLNYGCPARKVIAREAGAAMLTDLDRLERVTTEGSFSSFPMFSPDGRQLAFVSSRGSQRENLWRPVPSLGRNF